MSDEATESRWLRAWRFVTSDVWDMDLAKLPLKRGLLFRAIRVGYLVVRGFQEDECPLQASALTFSTLMALVPVLALSLAMARGLGGAEVAKERIRAGVHEWTASFSTAVATNQPAGAPREGVGSGLTNAVLTDSDASYALASEINLRLEDLLQKVDNISFTGLGGIGLVALIVMVLQVLGQVEASFNRVWGVTVPRSVWRKFTDYVSVLLILPILAVAASSVPVADYVARFLDPRVAQVVQAFVDSAPSKSLTVLLMTTLCFGFVIVFIPNTTVRIGPGLCGGVVTAVLFIVWLKLCAALQIGAANYGKIYGSFAIVPIVLAWVFVSWEILLFGAEVAFGVQNHATYRLEATARKANVPARVLLAVAVLVEVSRCLLKPGRVFRAQEFASERGIPVRFMNEVMDDLVHWGYLGELSGQSGYALLKAPDQVTVDSVIRDVLQSGVAPQQLGLGSVDRRVWEGLDQLQRKIEEAAGRTTLRDLAGA